VLTPALSSVTSHHQHNEYSGGINIQIVLRFSQHFQVFVLALSGMTLSTGSPVPSPSPLLPSLASLMSLLGSVLQAVVTGGGTAGGAAGGAGAAGAGGAATLPAVVAGTGGTAAVAPAMMMMSSLLPGIGLGLIKGLFIGKTCSMLNYRMLIIDILAELLKEQAPKKAKGYGHHPPPSYGHHQPQYGYQRRHFH
jgi:hypothetical protein